MRINTLKRNKEFRFVYGRGKSVSTKLMVLVYLKRRNGGLRPGFSISKKVGGAVVRNRTRRRFKAAYSELMKEIPGSDNSSCDLIFIARQPITNAEYKDILKDMRNLLHKAAVVGAATAPKTPNVPPKDNKEDGQIQTLEKAQETK